MRVGSGELWVDSKLVDIFIDDTAGTGNVHGRLSRQSADSMQLGSGCVEFLMYSETTLYLTMAGG